MSTITLLVFRDGLLLGQMSPQQFWAAYGDSAPADPPPTGPVVDPPTGESTKPRVPSQSDLLGIQLGSRQGNPVYLATDGDWFYELAEGKLWPRGTNLSFEILPGTNPDKPVSNPARDGHPGVPLRYGLPTGWGWFKASDGAFGIVPQQTTQAGPDWIQMPSASAPAASTDLDLSTLNPGSTYNP